MAIIVPVKTFKFPRHNRHCCFLIEDKAKKITGQNIIIDDGFSLIIYAYHF